MPQKEILKRLLSKTKRDTSGCLMWTAAKNPKGYGRFRYQDKTEQAHRVSYILQRGPIPNDLLCLHSCDRTSCIEISHLSLGTAALNSRQMVERNRQAKEHPMAQGERNHRSKITEDQAKEIKSLLLQKIPAIQISSQLNIYKGIVYDIKRGKIWTHIPPSVFERTLGRYTSKEEALRIKTLLMEGLTAPQIAKTLGVKLHAVKSIREGKTFKHVPID